jgi:hypothetical protein
MRDILPSLTMEEAEQALAAANGHLYEAVNAVLAQACESGVCVYRTNEHSRTRRIGPGVVAMF